MDTPTPHDNSTAATLQALVENVAAALRIDLRTSRGRRLAGAMRDAYDLGKIGPTSTAPLTASATPVHVGDRAGMVANVVHTIAPDTIEKYGVEDAMLAFTKQTIRELSQHGAHPDRDATIQFVGMLDGTIVVTGEALLGDQS